MTDCISFQADVPNALPRPVIHKLRERITPLDLMGAGGLDVAVRHREVTQADAAQITPLMQEVFDYVSTRRIGLWLPGGDYFLNDKLLSTGPITIIGEGMPNSRLIWTADAIDMGILVESQGSSNSHGSLLNRTTSLERLALLTHKMHEGVALTIDMSNSISGLGVLVDRTTPRVMLDKVIIQGATALNVDAWDGGVDLISCQDANLRNVFFLGYQEVFGDPNDSSFAYRARGDGKPTQLKLIGCEVSAAAVGLDTSEQEGVEVTNSDFVSVDIGIRANNVAIEPQVAVHGSHIAANVKCAELTNCVEFVFSGSDLYPNGPQSGDFIGIHVKDGCARGVIANNNFVRPNITSLYRGVVEDGGTETFIHGNTFSVGSSPGCIAIDLTANAVRPQIGRNAYPNAHKKIRDNGATSPVLDGWQVIAVDKGPVSHTGSTGEVALATIPIPAKAMGPNGAIRVYALYSWSNDASNKSPIIRLGGTAFVNYVSANTASNAIERVIKNQNNAASQVCFPSGANVSFTVSVSSPTTGAVNTDVAQDLVLAGLLADAADTVTLVSYVIEVLYRP